MVKIDRVVVINPLCYSERLSLFDKNYPSWLPAYEVYAGKTGAEVSPPEWWLAPRNAWALYENAREVIGSITNITLLLEDDCRFSTESETITRKCLDNIPLDWDMIYLGGGVKFDSVYPPYMVNEHCMRMLYTQFTHAIIFNPLSVKKILTTLDVQNWQADYTISHEYDQSFGFASVRGQLKAYSPTRFVAGQFGLPSTLRAVGGNGAPCFNNNYLYRDLSGRVVRQTEKESE